MSSSSNEITTNSAKRSDWSRLSAIGGDVGLLVVLAALILLFGSLSDHFFRFATFRTIANQIPDLLVIAVGMTFVLMVSGIDLSVGSVMALSGAVIGLAMTNWEWSLWAAIPLSVVVGLLCGLINGYVSVGLAIPSFIVTLGMLEFARGAAYRVADSRTKYIGAAIEPVGSAITGVGLSPAFFVSVGIVVVAQIILTRTVFGRYVTAVGNNEIAARYSGISPSSIRLRVFALCGALSGLAGLFQTSRLSSADPNAGIGMELDAIAAVVIGGTSLRGGKGSIVRSFVGVLIIAVLRFGLASKGVDEPVKRMITGAVIVLAVILDALKQRQRWVSESVRK